MSLKWVDLNGIRDAISDVRNDKTPTNWVLLSYKGENTNDLGLLGSGDGGVSELISHLKDNMVGFGLVRVMERFDSSDTVKFVFVNWVGESIHRMLRARLGTHSGAIKEILQPYHVNVDATNHSEISEEIITKTVSKASGTAVHVLAGSGGAARGSSSSSPSMRGSGGGSSGSPGLAKPSSVPKSSDNVKFADEENIRRAIADVRSDGTETNWVLLTYDGPNSNTIVLHGAGEGGSEELINHLKDDVVMYGLLRQQEKYDDSTRVMFAYVNWIGESVHRMLKARLGTHTGAVKSILTPYHADISATNPSEISPRIITTTIRNTMGTNTHVLH